MNSQGGFHRSRPQIERMDSRRILRENIIHQSIDYEVRYEDSGPLRASSTSHDFDSIQGESSGIHPSHGV